MTYSLSLRFEWDGAKDLSNQRKHGLSFGEAKQLFESGGDYLDIIDADHSVTEDRFIAIGAVDRGIVAVVYTEREENLIRIIGARVASRSEQALFRSYMEWNR